MDDGPNGEPPKPGLRERKKAKTRALIQAEALRLFREQGYDETSIEQIAEAAEVSPSTVFRYFTTKADLVSYDDLDERMVEAFQALPPDISAIQAIRSMFNEAFGSVGGADLEVQQERAVLVLTVPELRASMLDELVRTIREMAGLLAERSGRSRDDDEVMALSGAVLGIAMAAMFGDADPDAGGDGAAWAERLVAEGGNWLSGFLDRVDRGLAILEKGFTL